VLVGRWLGLVIAPVALWGCVVEKGEPTPEEEDPHLVLLDTNNYIFAQTIGMRAVEVQPEADLTVDWSQLGIDLRGGHVDPAGIEELPLVKFDFVLADLLDQIGDDELDSQAAAAEVYLYSSPGTTLASASEFEITGIGFEPLLLTEDPTSTWTVSAVDYPGGRLDLRMAVAIVPTATSTNTTVQLLDGDTTITVDALDLNRPPVSTTAGASRYSVDWSDVRIDVFGHAFDPLRGDELMVGRYDGTIEDVEADFLQLDSELAELYRASVLGRTELDDLSEAVDEAGNPFPGFTADGTWLVGIGCTTCSTPVPLYLAVVELVE
jgi:hypothetical protein